MNAGPLTRAQLEFIAWSVEKPRPHRWLWLKADGERSLSPLTHRYFVASKRVGGTDVESCRITVAELDALAPYWATNLLALNDAGRAALLVEVAA